MKAKKKSDDKEKIHPLLKKAEKKVKSKGIDVKKAKKTPLDMSKSQRKNFFGG